METDDLRTDDLLGRMMGMTPPESPSEGFAGKVMEEIRPVPSVELVKRPFFLFLSHNWGWMVLGIFSIGVLISMGIPAQEFLPGKGYFTALAPYYESLFTGLKNLFVGSKAVTMTLLLIFAGALLYGLDLLINRRTSARHHAA